MARDASRDLYIYDGNEKATPIFVANTYEASSSQKEDIIRFLVSEWRNGGIRDGYTYYQVYELIKRKLHFDIP